MSYRVVIVESSQIIREGLCKMLYNTEFDVVACFDDMRTLYERYAMEHADVVIVGSYSLVAAEQNIRMAYPELQSVALVLLSTTVCEDELVRQFDSVINIYDSQRAVLHKLQSALEQSQTNPYTESHDLSERERDVLILVAKGLANKEIADKLNISVHTVMSHRKNITHKTGIKSVAGLTVYALLNNMLEAADVTL